MKTRGAHVVRPRADTVRRLGGNHHPIASPLDRLSENFLGLAARIHVGRVEHHRARLEAQVNQARGLLNPVGAPLGKSGPAPERSGAKAQHRHLESGTPQLSVFHCAYGRGAKPNGWAMTKTKMRPGGEAPLTV